MREDEFDTELYVEREVDRVLLSKLRAWNQGRQKIRWISLESEPGRGNSWLLNRIYYHATNDSNFKLGVRVILIKGGETEYSRPPQGLSPFATELFQIYSSGRLSRWRRLKLRLHHASSWQLARAALVFFAGLMLSSLFVGFNQYVTSINSKLIHVDQWFPRFWSVYFLEHYADFLLWFITGSIVGLPFSMALLYLARNRILPPADTVAPTDEDFEYFRQDSGLIYSLQQICQGRRAVLLLADDAHCLPKPERQFLHQLFYGSSNNPEINRFRDKHSIMIVSLNKQSDNWQELLPDRMQKQGESFVVPQFSPIELREIAKAQLQQADGFQMGQDEFENLLEQAHRQENVKVLFAHRYDQLVDEMGQEFLKAKQNDIESVFGVDEVMAFQAVRLERSVEEKYFLAWLKFVADSDYLKIFDMAPPDGGVQQLLKNFLGETSLAHKSGKVCYFDTTRCRALQFWLKEHSPQLLAQAHYFWFWNATNQVTPQELKPQLVTSLNHDSRKKITEGAWHATRIGYVLESATAVLEQTGLTEQQRKENCYAVAASLLSSAALRRSEGDTFEADELIIDAEEWLGSPNGAQREEWLESAAEQLWEDYWLSGATTTRTQITALAEQFPEVSSKLCWILNLRLEQLVRGAENLIPVPAEPSESNPALCNLHRLVNLLLDIRNSHGFVAAALRDPELPIREPVIARGNVLAEFYLRQLQAMAFNERNQQENLINALTQWRERLIETKPSGGSIGDEALHAYNEARYWHLLADFWVTRTTQIEELPSEQIEASLQELNEIVGTACLRTPGETSLYDFIQRESQHAYERALQIAALLGWRTIVLETSFHLGTLLQRHTPLDKRSEHQWWAVWDGQFSQCIELEKDLGWLIHTPSIHRIRWTFLEKEVSREHCVEDAYNTLVTLERAHYPNALRLRFHDQISALLTNYSDYEINRERTAALHEIWAHKLAKLPEAAQLWDFRCLQHEQANSLGFAAQAQRLLLHLDKAERLLDEADALLAEVPIVDSEGFEKEIKLRDLYFGLKAQRAWLRQAQGHHEEHHDLVRSILRGLRPDDRISANMLGSLLDVEEEEKLLHEPWPPAPGMPINADPDNPNLSLPADWFTGDHPLEVRNRFDFRLRQLVFLSCSAKEPTLNLLFFLTWADWPRRSRFGETCIRFAHYGRKLGSDLSENSKALIIILLKAVRFYFDKIEEVDRHELEVLLMLIQYGENSVEYRVAYIKALQEHRYLLERELRVRQEAQDWFAVAVCADDYLDVLVDASLFAHRAGAKLQLSGVSLTQIHELRERRSVALRAAQGEYHRGNHARCLQLLEPVLPVATSPWVFLEDLQVLNLWLKSAKASTAYNPDEYGQHTSELRKSALQYIHQFSEVIEDRQIQSLALELLDKLQVSKEISG